MVLNHMAEAKATKKADQCPPELMVASHNQRSIEHTLARMKELSIPQDSRGGVFFAQLLGMADHLSFSLGQHGFMAYKYVPYGPIEEVLPYLLRRAEENSSLLGGTAHEMDLMKSELSRRLFSSH